MNEAYILNDSQVVNLPIELVSANPYQPRRRFDRQKLEELAASIKDYGVLQPISVRLINNTVYELVAGERRLRASKLAGKSHVPAIIINISDQESAMLALIENLQRQDLNYFEEAEGFACLLDDFNFTQEQLAKRVGKNQSTIANKLRLLKLPNEVKKALTENDLTERHARALLRLESPEEMETVLQKVISDNMNVSKTEAYIERFLAQKHAPKAKNVRIKTYIKDLRIFTNTVKQAVDFMNAAGVATSYELEETPGGCEIKIAIAY